MPRQLIGSYVFSCCKPHESCSLYPYTKSTIIVIERNKVHFEFKHVFGVRMIIGVMADTHDRLPLLDKAVKRLNKEGVELVLHAGDYIAPFVVQHFKPLNSPLIGVFGNNDAERDLLRKKFADMGAELRGCFTEVKVKGSKIALLHGEETELLNSLISAECHDIIIYGHTHEANTYRRGKTLVLNPGEVCGYLTGKSTMVVLNTKTFEVETILLK